MAPAGCRFGAEHPGSPVALCRVRQGNWKQLGVKVVCQVLGFASSSGSTDFDLWWLRTGEWVEPPNRRRGGESGVQRLRDDDGRLCYIKRQVGHVYRSLLHPLGRPTILREAAALRAWQQLGVRVPQVRYVAARSSGGEWQALLVTEALEGFQDMQQWYAAGGREQCGEAWHVIVLQTLGATLARLHAGHWQHGCLYPKHIFVALREDGAVEVALLDLEKSRRRLLAKRAARHDFAQLRRHSSFNDADWSQLLYGYRSEQERLKKRKTA